MATSNKKLNGTRGEYYSMTLSYVENSYSIENNTSNVTITGTIQSDSSYYSYYGYTNTGKLSIDGTEVKTGTSTANVTTSGVTLFTYTGNIAHSSDGTKTATLKYDFSTTYSYLSSTSLSVNFTLTTIPRASTLTLTASSLTITNATATLGFTATSKGNFYHKLSWKVGSSSASVVSGWNPKQINTTSASGTITTGAILDKMPTSTSGTLTFTLETFTDSAMTNKTGTSTATCSISINTSNIKPSVNLGTISVNTPSSFTNLVAGYSTAKVTVTSTNSRGASSFSTSFTISKGSLSANSTSSTSYTLKTNTLPSGTSNYTFTITATITDSRGVSATASKTSGTVYGYATPVISAQFYRVAESGSSTADPIGAYVYRSFSATQSYTVNGWNNTLTVTAKQDGITVTSGTTSALADTSSSTLVVTATDKVTTVTKTLTVGTATFPLDLYDNAQGIVGVGMGTTAEGGLVQSNMDIRIVKDNQTMVRGYNTGDIYARGNISNDGWMFTKQDMHAEKGFYSYRATYSGGNTASGCVRFATIKITSTNTNGPLTILISPRGMSPTWLTVRFNNSGVDPVLDDCMTRGGNVICGIRKTATSTWDLYCQTGGSYQNILFEVVASPMLYQGATLTWDNTVSTSWPSDIVYATRGTITPMGTGNVNTANGSLNGQLVIKSASASADGTPNNGIVFEFGNSTTWRGQLFFADNGSEGVWTSGWYSGTHQPWRRLFESNDYRTQNTFVTTGLTYYNSRATLSAGGYFTSGKMVFVAFSLKINATMGAPDYWLMIKGLPKPRFLTALSCAGINKKGTYGAWINGSGEINIQTSSTSLTSGDYIAITGFYFIA